MPANLNPFLNPPYGSPAGLGSALPYTQMGGMPQASTTSAPGGRSLSDMMAFAKAPSPGIDPDTLSSISPNFDVRSMAPKAPAGMFGARPSTSAAAQPLNQPAPLSALTPNVGDIDTSSIPKAHLGFFDKGGLGSKILGGLGEFALRYSAGQGNPMALMTLRQRMEGQIYQRDRADSMSDAQRQFQQQMMLEQYRRGTPNDEFSHYLDAGGFSPEQRQQLYRQRATSMANPVDWITANNGDGTKTVIPRPRFGSSESDSGSGSAPEQAVAALRADPSLAPQFDAKYGIGAHLKYLGANGGGGAGLNTPQTFR